MAKLPITRDRFRIIAETSEDMLGPVLSALTRMGITNIGYELLTDVRTFQKNETHGGTRRRFEISGKEEALKLFQSDDIVTLTFAKQAFELAKRTPNSVSPILDELLKEGVIERIAPGQYRRLKLALPAPQGTKKPATKAKLKPNSGKQAHV
jgi:hypothetical protein